MKLVPTSKMDLEACANLSAANDEEIMPFVTSLLEWLQDMNWPVAPLVQERLAKLGSELVVPVRAVLNGNDNVWKYWLVSSFLPLVRAEVFRELSTEIERIASDPTGGEMNEGVHLAAEQLLSQKSV
jgi:hypothetical protein